MVESFAIRTFLFVEEISRCYHSNEFSLAEPCILQFFSWDFEKRNLNFFSKFLLWLLLAVKDLRHKLGEGPETAASAHVINKEGL